MARPIATRGRGNLHVLYVEKGVMYSICKNGKDGCLYSGRLSVEYKSNMAVCLSTRVPYRTVCTLRASKKEKSERSRSVATWTVEMTKSAGKRRRNEPYVGKGDACVRPVNDLCNFVLNDCSRGSIAPNRLLQYKFIMCRYTNDSTVISNQRLNFPPH